MKQRKREGSEGKEGSAPKASAMPAHGPTDCELEILIGILCHWTTAIRAEQSRATPTSPRLASLLLLLLTTNRCEIVDEFSRIRLIRFLIFVAAAGKVEEEEEEEVQGKWALVEFLHFAGDIMLD